MQNKYSNTKKKGLLHFYLVQAEEQPTEYMAVCWNLNLVEYGTNLGQLMESITEGAISYLKAVQSKNLPNRYLNQSPSKEIMDKIHRAQLIAELYQKSRKPTIKETTLMKNINPASTLLQFHQTPYDYNHLAFHG